LKIVWIYKYLVYASLFCVPWGSTGLNLKLFFTLEMEFFMRTCIGQNIEKYTLGLLHILVMFSLSLKK